MADFLLFREAGAGVRKIAARLVMDGADEVFVQKAELTNSSGEELGTSTVPLSVSPGTVKRTGWTYQTYNGVRLPTSYVENGVTWYLVRDANGDLIDGPTDVAP